MAYVARKAENIEADIERNWSSWNYGAEGFEGTKEELNAFLAEATDEDSIWISGLDLFADDVKKTQFGQLWANYWVAIDTVNARNGLSCIDLEAEDFESAVIEALANESQYCGDGSSFDASCATLVFSQNNIHIFEIE